MIFKKKTEEDMREEDIAIRVAACWQKPGQCFWERAWQGAVFIESIL